jgi:formate hydrogenlyase subunit 6/NADH:ubiquinone oxidoreductase subunit I
MEACPKKCIATVAEYRAPEYAKETREYQVPQVIPNRVDANEGEEEEKSA